MNKLRDASKCRMAQREVKFFGHLVNAGGYQPDPANVEAVSSMQPPTKVKEVRRFLGMTGSYRKHREIFQHSLPSYQLNSKTTTVRVGKGVPGSFPDPQKVS